ncbi:expressed unknown protein [Ectocarpus siliculosus]|uniref:Uncharacterized protein n=1 Tax=Ectocarpus siliculosus TaxID=2880 RepID=D7FPH0_ECTSI|nr:expressed unknown protein [Ectocarpus siliculosus]|eukprot:CBJ30428.1 expressed unknown protein [Ectocarpus siliculosus]
MYAPFCPLVTKREKRASVLVVLSLVFSVCGTRLLVCSNDDGRRQSCWVCC